MVYGTDRERGGIASVNSTCPPQNELRPGGPAIVRFESD